MLAQSGESRDAPVATLYAFDMQARPLEDALEALIRETDISLFYESSLVEGLTVDCKIGQADLEGLLDCILSGTGLDFYRLSGGTFVLSVSAEGAPRTGSIAGHVVDAASGIPVRDAHVRLPDLDLAVSADNLGRFTIQDLPTGPHELLVTHVAYDAERDSVFVTEASTAGLVLIMRRRILQSGPVIVVEGAPPLLEETFNRRNVDGNEPASVPYGDLSVMPVLESGAAAMLRDGYGELHVQGGSAGHVEYRIDGVPIFNPIPNGGVITPFSPTAIGYGIVYGAGFGADVGSHLSGVVELEHAVPRVYGTHALARFDPVAMNGRVTHARPMRSSGNMAFLLGLRTAQFNRFKPSALLDRFAEWSAPDIFLATVLGTGTGADDAVQGAAVDFDVFDAHGAVVLNFGSGRELAVSGYFGRNEFG
ncbi:MAG: hypothetical protein HKN17_03985, partial [Rhodothermales bacterium]|nr:hypothetical protein [Rhodothermales bacterium]